MGSSIDSGVFPAGDAGGTGPLYVNPDTTTPSPSFLSYLSTVSGANVDFRITQYKSQQDQIAFLQGIFSKIGIDANAQIQLFTQQITDAQAAWKSLYDGFQSITANIQSYNHLLDLASKGLNKTIAYNDWQNLSSMNGNVSGYETQMQAQVDTLYAAINTYNQTVPATSASQQALQTAIATYNTNTAAINSSYSAQVTAYNSATTQAALFALNQQLASAGLPPLAPSPLPTAPGPLSTTSGAFAPPSTSSLPPPPITTPKPIVASQTAFAAYDGNQVETPPNIFPQTTDLATAIANYNTAVTNANAVYDVQAQAYNDLIATINVVNGKLALVGIETLTPTSNAAGPVSIDPGSPYAPPSASAPLPISGVPLPSVPALTGTIPAPLTLEQAIAIYLPILSNQVIASKFNIASATSGFLQNFALETDPFQGDITLPAAYTKPHTIAPSDVSPTSGVPTVALAATAIGAGAPRFQTILVHSLFMAVLAEENRVEGTQIATRLEALIPLLLRSAATQAAASALRQFPQVISQASEEAEKSQAPSQGLGVINSVALSNQILALVASGGVGSAINELLRTVPEFASLDLDQQNRIAKGLVAAVNLVLLEIAVSQLSFATRLPGLSAQVLGNVQGQPPASTESNGVNNVLNNPVSVQAIVQALTPQVSLLAGLTQEQAQSVVVQAINDAIAQGLYSSAEKFRDAVEKSLIKANLDAEAARKVANLAAEQVKEEVSLPPLETLYKPGALQAAVGAFVSAPPAAGTTPEAATAAIVRSVPELSTAFPVGSPQRIQLENLVGDSLKNPVIAQTVSQTLAQNFNSKRDFRTALLTNLTAAGLTATEATRVAKVAVKALTLEPVSPTPLTAPTVTGTAPIPVLAEEFNGAVTEQLKGALGPAQAQNSALDASRLVAKFVTAFDDQVTTLKQNDLKGAQQKFTDSIGSMSTPNIPLFAMKATLAQFVVNAEINSYQTPADLGDLGKVDLNKAPASWRGSTILPA